MLENNQGYPCWILEIVGVRVMDLHHRHIISLAHMNCPLQSMVQNTSSVLAYVFWRHYHSEPLSWLTQTWLDLQPPRKNGLQIEKNPICKVYDHDRSEAASVFYCSMRGGLFHDRLVIDDLSANITHFVMLIREEIQSRMRAAIIIQHCENQWPGRSTRVLPIVAPLNLHSNTYTTTASSGFKT